MDLAAELTTGWRDDPEADCAARKLHSMAATSGEDYAHALAGKVAQCSQISGLDQLFRRRTDGFDAIKALVGGLANLPSSSGGADPLICRIDVFAYAFLKGAKNFDFLLPLAPKSDDGFRNTYGKWLRTISALENFERLGDPLVANSGVSASTYLAVRKVLSRPSARDETRALATLLISGPSTLADISGDLGLNYTLGQRTVAVFENIGVLERRVDGSGEVAFAIADPALPLVVFFLRETMGLDLLSALAGEF